MKTIAISGTNNKVEEHFGHSSEFQVFSVDGNKNTKHIKTLSTNQTCGCKSNISKELKEAGVSELLTGNLGRGANIKLTEAGINVITGFSGSIETALKQWLKGDYQTTFKICEGGHEEGHQCNH